MPVIVRSPEHRALVSVLVACRKEAGLTQAQLGERCGRDQAWVSAIETGQRDVGVAELVHLARAFGMEPLTLFQRFVAFLPPQSLPSAAIPRQLAGTPVEASAKGSARTAKKKGRKTRSGR